VVLCWSSSLFEQHQQRVVRDQAAVVCQYVQYSTSCMCCIGRCKALLTVCTAEQYWQVPFVTALQQWAWQRPKPR
jgi:hypothetical protein